MSEITFDIHVDLTSLDLKALHYLSDDKTILSSFSIFLKIEEVAILHQLDQLKEASWKV